VAIAFRRYHVTQAPARSDARDYRSAVEESAEALQPHEQPLHLVAVERRASVGAGAPPLERRPGRRTASAASTRTAWYHEDGSRSPRRFS
jgi:hypothetical protein